MPSALRSTGQQPPDTPFSARPLCVLLIEDNADDAFLLERHLQRAGYRAEIRRVETEAEMQAALQPGSQGWHVILADYNLPTFSALAALRLLRTSGLDIPLIVMSGVISEETAVAAMRAGAHDYVAKQNLARLVPAIEREITDAEARRVKRAAEQALRVAEERFHRLVEAMPMGLLISDHASRVLYANEGVEKLLGYSQAELVSGEFTLTRLLTGNSDPPGAGSEIRSGIDQRLRAPGGCEPFELECMRSDGSVVPALIGASILNPESSTEDREIAAFIVDLTEQKQSQNALRRTEKLAVAGRLAASIAHEINNPLESVTNCLYLLQKSQIDDAGRSYLDLAQRELDRVVHITTQTLRFYRQSTRPALVDIHELLATVLALFDLRLRSTGIEVACEYQAVPAVTAYDGEVRQVLANLVGNAVDAMSSGGRLTLRTAATRDWSGNRRGVSITIADTGHGMDPATRGRLFEPFFSTKGVTGTGLGLWVSQGIIAKHHGRLQIFTRQGECSGTVFRLFLPFDSPLSQPLGAVS